MKIGFTCSCFDLFHAGHVMMLKEASTVCDYLIVGLQTDPTIDRPNKNKPVQSVLERYIQLKACKYVDEILVYESEFDLLQLDLFLLFIISIARSLQTLDRCLAHKTVVSIKVQEQCLQGETHDESVAQEVRLIKPEGRHCHTITFTKDVEVTHFYLLIFIYKLYV